jgi:hypothetical protein
MQEHPMATQEMTVTQTRAQATQYDLLCAIDELLQPDFTQLVAREELLGKMLEAWLAVPAFQRQDECHKLRACSLQAELQHALAKCFEARAWSWTRRVAGYRTNRVRIEHA